MPREAHLHIFSIKSISLLKNVTIHENSIKGLKIPRPPAVPVQARLRVPEQKKPLQTCLRRLFPFLKRPIPRRDKPAAGRRSRAGPAVSPGGSSRPGRGPISIRDGLENAFHPAGSTVQMQHAGKAVLHLQHGLVPQGQRRAA